MFLEGCERRILGFLLTLLSCQPCVFWPSNVPSSRHDARNFSKVVQKPYFHNQHGSHDRMQSLTWILLKSRAMVEDQWKQIWSSNGRAQWWYDQRVQDEQRHGSRHEYGSWQERVDASGSSPLLQPSGPSPRRDRSRSREKTWRWHWGSYSWEAPACPADGSSSRYNRWSEKISTNGHTTTRTPPQKHHHKNTTTKTPPHHQKNTTTKTPSHHHHKNTTTRTPPQKHHHKNTTTRTPPQKRHHTTTKTPPQEHHHKNTTKAPPQEHHHTTTKTPPHHHLFFGCQLLGYVSRAVRPSVSYNNAKRTIPRS